MASHARPLSKVNLELDARASHPHAEPIRIVVAARLCQDREIRHLVGDNLTPSDDQTLPVVSKVAACRGHFPLR